MHYQPWSGADLAALRSMAKTHTSLEVALELNRSEPAVRQQAYRLKIRFRKAGARAYGTARGQG
ncbi:hypothetical protein [Arenimonas sp.]|uniref:hypothetical protein n=1 Tax=Arenimonas sp. TaxID=1872635 RepID=UPI0039E30005